MKQEFDEYLVKTYPEIFRDRHGDPMKTLMCFGFGCGDGWFDLIDTMCKAIQNHINFLRSNNKEIEQVVAAQVKEKFGGLRFYYEGGDDYVRGVVDLASHLSEKTCETCGSTTNIGKTSGWIKIMCEDCSKTLGPNQTWHAFNKKIN